VQAARRLVVDEDDPAADSHIMEMDMTTPTPAAVLEVRHVWIDFSTHVEPAPALAGFLGVRAGQAVGLQD